jgi:hypothetical protein
LGVKRGQIRNREQYGKIKDYSGLTYGKITPGDIDGFVEFRDKLFVFIEIKHNEAKLPTGQKLALERLCDALQESGRTSAVLVAVDRTDAGDIDVAALPVELYRYRKEWRVPKSSCSVRQAVESLMAHADYSIAP